MARNVHWRIEFRTHSERLGVLTLYEDGYEGDIVELAPGAVPFETEEDTDEDVMKPVRHQTGYVRVIDDGNLDGLMPSNLMDRYVEYREDDVLVWRGYMQPSTFSEPWDVQPIEVEYPVISTLGVLESQYLDSGSSMGVASFAAILREVLGTLGVDYSRMYVPYEFMDTGEGDVLVPMRMGVARYNFFTDSGDDKEDESWYMYESDTCMSVLGEICKFFGWTVVERGDVLYFVSRRTNRYVELTDEDFVNLSYGFDLSVPDAVEMRTHELGELELAGMDHTKSILTGYKKVTIKAGVNPVSEAVPNISEDQVEFAGTVRYEGKGVAEIGGVTYTPKLEQTRMYRSDNVNIDFLMYRYNQTDNVWEPLYYDVEASRDYAAAAYVEYDAFTEEDLEEKKNYSFRKALRITSYDQKEKLYPDLAVLKTKPLARIKSKRAANYRNGAFVLSASIGETSIGEDEELNLYVKLSVGNLYWNGEGWGREAVVFEVPIDMEGKKLKNTKTLDMPYNGADGYIMPIDRALSGDVELTLYPLLYGNLAFFDDLSVQYFGDDDVTDSVKSSDTNRYYKKTESPFAEEKEVSIKLATSDKNKAGYGIVSLHGEDVMMIWSVVNGDYQRPERYLLETMAGIYGRTTDKLEVELVKMDMKPVDVVEWHGRRYMPVAEATDWAGEVVRCILMEV